jgi:hypothetical protein
MIKPIDWKDSEMKRHSDDDESKGKRVRRLHATEYDDDVDDEFDDDEDDAENQHHDVVPDGGSVRVPIQFMDSTQRAIAFQDTGAAHRPGWRMSDDADNNDAHQDAEDARDEYIRYLQDAHRTAAATDEPERPRSLRDARAAADQAREERDQWLRDAHKQGRQP